MSVGMQVKLLRILEEKKIRRVGGEKTIPVDVRIVSATNQDLKTLCQQNKFREDLFYRLNLLNIELPPLRDRVEDIPLLVEHFMKEIYNDMTEEQKEKKMKTISKEAMKLLTKNTWPGNIRQLRNEVVRAYLSSGEIIQPDDLSHDLVRTIDEKLVVSEGSFKERISDFERRVIEEELKKNNYNIRATARHLKMNHSSLIRWISILKINIPKKGSRE